MSKVLSHQNSKCRTALWAILGLLLVASVACTPAPTDPTPTTWTFTVKVVYAQDMIAAHGGETALKQKIKDQLTAVGNTFIGFDKPVVFSPLSFGSYTGDPNAQRALPHPEANLLLIYSEDTTKIGGWDGVNQAILHIFYLKNGSVLTPDTFSTNATDALKHEARHFRGAIDMYAQNVSAALNPVSGTAYQSVTSIMDYPYGNAVDDDYTKCIVNKSANTVGATVPVVAVTLPSVYQVSVHTAGGVAVNGASVSLYPVVWYSNSVSSSPALRAVSDGFIPTPQFNADSASASGVNGASITLKPAVQYSSSVVATPAAGGTTGSNGVFQLAANPFKPLQDLTAPWEVAYSNFLVKAQLGTAVSYTWLPISVAGLSDCNHHGDPLVVNLPLG